MQYTLCFGFSSTNNKAKYEALIIGLRISKELGIQHLKACSDLQLVVSHAQNECEAKEENISKYLLKIKDNSNLSQLRHLADSQDRISKRHPFQGLQPLHRLICMHKFFLKWQKSPILWSQHRYYILTLSPIGLIHWSTTFAMGLSSLTKEKLERYNNRPLDSSITKICYIKGPFPCHY